MSIDLIRLSKVVSQALRHEPMAYGLKLDSHGWVSLSDLALSLKNKGFADIEEGDIMIMVEKSDKKRHQILDDKIRALYGHSISEKIIKQHQMPPGILYHGTNENSIVSIQDKGLLPMSRQYVHLSISEGAAFAVANRKKGKSVILEIKASDAYKNGVHFYEEENGIWLSEAIPPQYITAV